MLTDVVQDGGFVGPPVQYGAVSRRECLFEGPQDRNAGFFAGGGLNALSAVFHLPVLSQHMVRELKQDLVIGRSPCMVGKGGSTGLEVDKMQRPLPSGHLAAQLLLQDERCIASVMRLELL